MRFSPPLKCLLLGIGALVAAGALLVLHLDNQRLRQRLVQHHAQHQQAFALHQENLRLQTALEAGGRDTKQAAGAVEAELKNLRDQITQLETKAVGEHAERLDREAHENQELATNRDPTRGFVRPEYFKERGQSTPTAAFETLVWAAMNGDENVVQKVTVLKPITRAQAEALIARLPQEIRSQWSAEKLAALWAAGALMEAPALQLTGEHTKDFANSSITFRLLGATKDEHVRLKRTPEGWKVVLPDSFVEKVEKKIRPREISPR
jgi:hypothetical protein